VNRVPVYEPQSKLIMAACVVVLLACMALIRCSAPADAAGIAGQERVAIPEQSARFRLALEHEAAARFGLDAPVARMAAQIHLESGWNPSAESAFAQGLAQFTPDTATWLPGVCPDVGKPDTWDPAWSLRAIACYDHYLYANVAGDSECDRWAFTLSAYNGGLGWVQRDRARAQAARLDPDRWWGSVERTSARASWARTENRDYVRRILRVLEPAYLDDGWSGQAVCT
jgi:soluble lytic murein transglycosylase-like protein